MNTADWNCRNAVAVPHNFEAEDNMTIYHCCGAWALTILVVAFWNHAAHRNNHLCKPYPMYCYECGCIADYTTIEGSSAICPECLEDLNALIQKRLDNLMKEGDER